MSHPVLQIIIARSRWLQWVWAATIFALCAMPGEYIPSNNWLELLSFDKLVHAGMFFVLSALFIVTGIRRGKSFGAFLLAVLLCVCYGASLELMQATIFRNRSADWNDIIANSIGCLLALAFANRLQAKITRA